MKQERWFRPGEVWLDTDGNRIRAHSGGMLIESDTYYWYGERREHFNTFPGISCYSSKDLLNWTYVGLALEPIPEDPGHDLHPTNIIERPKVIYNDRTKQYVMWMHVENHAYTLAHAGVAVSDSPTGPFRYIGKTRPNGCECRDMTLYQDDDGKAYLIHSSEGNANLHINLLTDDYLAMEGTYRLACEGMFREAPAVFKREGRYYLIASGCTGFSPNPTLYAVSDSMLGDWQVQGLLAHGPGANSTFHSQPTYAFSPIDDPDRIVLMSDRWFAAELGDSRYVWLPIRFESGTLSIDWLERWNFEEEIPGVYKGEARGPQVEVPFRGDGGAFRQTMRLGSGSEKAEARFSREPSRLLAEVDLSRPLRPSVKDMQIWNQDHLLLSIGDVQWAIGFLEDESPWVVPGTYLDYIGVPSLLPEDAASYVKTERRPIDENGMVLRVDISLDMSFPLLPALADGDSIPLAIEVYRGALSENSAAGRTSITSPAGLIWGDPSTYHHAVWAGEEQR